MSKMSSNPDLSDDEIARRRGEVVRRMANAPPKPRKAKSPRPLICSVKVIVPLEGEG
jgi:hypothetical protein